LSLIRQIFFIPLFKVSVLCVFDKMDKLEYRSVIPFGWFIANRNSPKKVYKEYPKKMYKEFAPSLSTVNLWLVNVLGQMKR